MGGSEYHWASHVVCGKLAVITFGGAVGLCRPSQRVTQETVTVDASRIYRRQPARATRLPKMLPARCFQVRARVFANWWVYGSKNIPLRTRTQPFRRTRFTVLKAVESKRAIPTQR